MWLLQIDRTYIVSSPANTQLDGKGFNSERRKFHPWLDIATSWYQCKRTSFKLHFTKIWASKSNRNPKMRQRLKLRRWRRSAVSTNLHKLVGKCSGFKISGISIFIQSSSILASKAVGFRYSDRAKAFLLQNPWGFDIYQYFDAGSPNLASKYLRKTTQPEIQSKFTCDRHGITTEGKNQRLPPGMSPKLEIRGS